MARLLAATMLTLLLGSAEIGSAQTRPYDDRAVEARTSTTRQLIRNREIRRARERRARLQSLKWRGISASRPLDRGGFGTFNLYRYEQQLPWYGPLLPVWYGAETTID